MALTFSFLFPRENGDDRGAGAGHEIGERMVPRIMIFLVSWILEPANSVRLDQQAIS